MVAFIEEHFDPCDRSEPDCAACRATVLVARARALLAEHPETEEVDAKVQCAFPSPLEASREG